MARNFQKSTVLTFLFLPAVLSILTILSYREPFIPSNSYKNFVYFVIFPIISGLFFYLTAIKRWKEGTDTGLQQQLIKATSKLGRIQTLFKYITLMLLISAVLTWMIHRYIIWPTKSLAATKVTFQATVISNTPLKRTMSGLNRLELLKPTSNETLSFAWPSTASEKLVSDTQVELHGTQNWFGATIESIKLNRDIH